MVFFKVGATSERVNEYVKKVKDQRLFGLNYVQKVKYGLLPWWCEIRRSQRVCKESSRSKTLWPEICSKGQICTTLWLMKHQNELMSMYRKFKMEDFFDLLWPYHLKFFQHCKYGLLPWWCEIRRSQWVCKESSILRTLWPEICSLGQICTTVWLMKHQNESRSMHRKFKIDDTLAQNMFRRSKMEYSLTDVTSERVYEYI